MNDKSDYIELGEKIRQRRAYLGLSQYKVAKIAELNAGHYSKIERGDYNVKFHNIVNIAAALNCSLDMLMNSIYDAGTEQYLSMILLELRKLTPEQRRFISEVIVGLQKMGDNNGV